MSTWLLCGQSLIGDRGRLKMLAREMNDVDVRDNAGNTPLMYTVMGRQSKVEWSVYMQYNAPMIYYTTYPGSLWWCIICTHLRSLILK